MTEKRFYLMNVEDPLHEYGRWCKPVLEDGKTGKQYENALEVMDLLNGFNDENEKLKQQVEFFKGYREDLEEVVVENEQLKEVLGSILIEVRRDISATNHSSEVKAFVNPNNFDLISDILRKYGALKEWYE